MIERDENGEFKITNANNVLKGEYNKPFVKNLAKEIIARLDIKKIEIFFTGGFVDDSFSSAMLCGTISSSVRALYSYLSQKYDDVKLYEDINPTYNESNLELTFDIVVSVSLIKLVGAVLKSNSKSKKEEIKNEG